MNRLIERIVVRLDAAAEAPTAIEAAARLAARAKAPLHGVFVEDEDLLHLTGLPFARHTTVGVGTEKLTAAAVELHLRATAERARRELLAAARRHHVSASFEIVRGTADAGLAAAAECDLLVAGMLTRPVAGAFRLECRWWSGIAAAAGPLLFVRHEWREHGAVVMLLRERDAASARLLGAAAQLAAVGDGALTVICPPVIAGARDFQKWLADSLAPHPVQVQVELAPDDSAALHQRIVELDCRLLAIDAASFEAEGGRLRGVAESLACGLLVVG